MRNPMPNLLLLLSILASMFCPPAAGQQGASAGVYGTVLDSQSAVVPVARVTLLHVNTNQARTAITDAAGDFRFPLLPVGEYRITVEQSGFKKYEQSGLLLQVNDNAKVDVKLEVGEISTQVSVEAVTANVENS